MHCTSLLALVAVASAVPNIDTTSYTGEAPSLSISSPNLTTKWFEGSDYHQMVELWVQNTDKNRYLTASHKLSVSVNSKSVDTVRPGTLKRLAPGQSALVVVGVKNQSGVKPGSACTGIVVAKAGKKKFTKELAGSCGIGDYESTEDSLSRHGTPQWFDDKKYGIFIHWGLYSVPAYGNTGQNENYAEWYWRWQHDPNDKTQTYQYHLEHYGKDFNYDEFVANFTGKGFDAKEWVNLISDAGAQYFVPTTKHHDGFALFKYPESAGKRSSVHYGPKRDFIGELFTASKKYQPHLRRGTYFSLPEWYNPQYKNGDSFPGGPPTNPYTGEEIEYTGYTPVNDFVNDIQVAQMNALAYDYFTELMWCDIGGPNNSTHMLSQWINWARDNGHQVAFDSRCGLKGDFDTPEYDPNPSNPFIRKWESSRGMDPHSYGYNHVTPDDEYLTGGDIVESLVDIVSNNGNFLLDIGPKGDGSIPDIMKKNLLDAGKWINSHAESIFNTRYWTVTTGKDPFRYTTTEDAFYIHYTKKPSKSIAIQDPVPFLPGDIVTVVGGKAHGRRVSYTWTRPGSLTLHLDDNMIAGDEYVWTFKIQYGTQ